MTGVLSVLAGLSPRPLTFVSSSSAELTTNGTSLTITAPAGILNGDRMYVVLNSDANETTSTATLAGWTSVGAYNANNEHMLILSKTASSESGSYTFLFNGTAQWGGAIVVYRGGQGLTDVVGTFTLTTGGSANITTGASITPTTTGTLLFFGVRLSDAAITVTTPPVGMTSRILDIDRPARFVYDLALQAATATGTKTLTWSNSRSTIGVLVQIK